MTDPTLSQPSGSERVKASLASEVVGFVTIAAAVVLGWQIVCVPLAERGPPELAVWLSPDSPSVLARAADAELDAQRYDNAEALARRAIARAPFSVLPMRVLAQVLEKNGQTERADEIMTLAGNLSLRDSISHGWLVDRRLRQGNYASAFGHTDTLLRRSDTIWPQGFELYAAGAAHDPRALAALRDIIARSPPWRRAFLFWLQAQDGRDELLGTLAVELQKTEQPLSSEEMEIVYLAWLGNGQIDAIKFVRQHTGQPPADQLLVDGDFSGPQSPLPFRWELTFRSGMSVGVVAGEPEGGDALRVTYDGRGAGLVARQMLTLAPGTYTLTGLKRVEQGESRLDWVVSCLESGQALQTSSDPFTGRDWRRFSMRIVIPQRCSAQWLELVALPGDFEEASVSWFDRLAIISGNDS